MPANPVEQITYYQSKLHNLLEHPDYQHGLAVLQVHDPVLPDVDSLKESRDPTQLEIAYLKYLIADIHIERDIAWCDNWNQDQLNYFENYKKLGKYLREIGTLPPLPLKP